MALASQNEIDKKATLVASLQDKLSNGLLSDKEICTILRSNIRRSWMRSPTRLLKLELGRITDTDPTTRTKWKCRCKCCGELFKITEIEVDHIIGEHNLKSLDDILPFTKSILQVTVDDLQLLCGKKSGNFLNCHDVTTYSERYGISFNEAIIEKKIIHWQKNNNPSKQIEILTKIGFDKSKTSNAVKRKNCYREYLKNK